jgi:hypothetical protein
MHPTPPPWLSPKVVTRNRRPNELPIARGLHSSTSQLN